MKRVALWIPLHFFLCMNLFSLDFKIGGSSEVQIADESGNLITVPNRFYVKLSNGNGYVFISPKESNRVFLALKFNKKITPISIPRRFHFTSIADARFMKNRNDVLIMLHTNPGLGVISSVDSSSSVLNSSYYTSEIENANGEVLTTLDPPHFEKPRTQEYTGVFVDFKKVGSIPFSATYLSSKVGEFQIVSGKEIFRIRKMNDVWSLEKP